MELSQGKGRIAYGIVKQLAEAGYVAYFAGGCVRDDLMNGTAEDFDIATSASPDAVEKIFPKTIAVGKQFGVIIVVEGETHFEVATFRREGSYRDGRHPSEVSFTNPEEDAKRRDFTVNGLFYDPLQKKVIDYVGGQKDIRAKIIRAIGAPDERFNEDKLRLLRAVRFASVLGFEIEPETWNAVCRRVREIHSVSPERIRDEIIKMLTRPGADRGLDLLSQSGLLKEILPEIESMKGIQQPPAFHPEGDVFIHTKLMLSQLEKPSPALALAVLFHDVGKPPTLAVRDGHITFYEHAPLGGRMTETIMRRLRFSNDEIETVAGCVENHMRFGDVQKMREGKLKRLLMRPTFELELELHRIDCVTSHGHLDNFEFLKAKQKEYAAEELKPHPLINGHDLIRIGMQPGPDMKTILEEIYDLQLEGQFKDKDDALAYAQNQLRLKTKKEQ